MAQQTDAYIRKLVLNDRDQAQDNLHRARIAARGCDPTKPWGASGQTLNEIIASYEKWLGGNDAALQSLLDEAAK